MAADFAAGEVRHQAIQRAQQRTLATATGSGQQHEFTFADGERNVVQRRRACIWIAIAERVNVDHRYFSALR